LNLNILFVRSLHKGIFNRRADFGLVAI